MDLIFRKLSSKLNKVKTHIKRAFASQLGFVFKDKGTAAAIILLFAVLSFAAGWIPDGFTALLLEGQKGKGIIMLTISSILLTTLGTIGVWLARELKFDVFEKEPEKKKILILFLSKNSSVTEESLKKAIEIIKKLGKEDLAPINKLVGNWRMPLEAIKYHLPRLEKIVVVTSPQSSEQINLFKILVSEVFGKDTAKKILEEKLDNFESIEKLFKKLDEIYKKLNESGYRNKDAIIDVTGGQKPISIAGALITFAYTDREFQYVSTNTYKVKSYDVRVVSNDKV